MAAPYRCHAVRELSPTSSRLPQFSCCRCLFDPLREDPSLPQSGHHHASAFTLECAAPCVEPCRVIVFFRFQSPAACSPVLTPTSLLAAATHSSLLCNLHLPLGLPGSQLVLDAPQTTLSDLRRPLRADGPSYRNLSTPPLTRVPRSDPRLLAICLCLFLRRRRRIHVVHGHSPLPIISIAQSLNHPTLALSRSLSPLDVCAQAESNLTLTTFPPLLVSDGRSQGREAQEEDGPQQEDPWLNFQPPSGQS